MCNDNSLHEFNKNKVQVYKYNKSRNHRFLISLMNLPGGGGRASCGSGGGRTLGLLHQRQR